MTQLYKLTAQHKDLLKLADESEDMAQAVADTMEALDGEFDDKAISLITLVNNMGTDITAIDAEIKRLTARKNTITNNQDSMREYLRVNMDECSIKKIQCPLFTITLANGRDMLEITDDEAIPTDYLDIQVTKKPIKKDLLDALKAGDDIPGVRIKKSAKTLRIK